MMVSPQMVRHEVVCPECSRSFPVTTAFERTPAPLPCSVCWRGMGARERAGWLRVMRAASPDRRALEHRDPVVYAPPTLKAYVEALEQALAGAVLVAK